MATDRTPAAARRQRCEVCGHTPYTCTCKQPVDLQDLKPDAAPRPELPTLSIAGRVRSGIRSKLRRTPTKERWLRRENRRLRWTKGNCTLYTAAPHPRYKQVRRDVVAMCLRTRQFRLALTVAVMPYGYSLRKEERRG